MRSTFLPILLLSALIPGSSAKPLARVLTGQGQAAPSNEMKVYMAGQLQAARAQWRRNYEALTDPAAIRAHESELRAKFIAAIGGLPERTPLNARTTGALEREGYRVEKVIYESRPHFYITAALFLPDATRWKPPYPGIFIPVGHFQEGKAEKQNQSMGALLALNGMAALVADPLEQGERLQLVDTEGKASYLGTSQHSEDDVPAILLGESIARVFVWDAMRGIDYLQSRPEVDPQRIGVTGNSGGGMLTCYLLALDDRVGAAAASCFMANAAARSAWGGGDGEQNIHGAYAFGMDEPDYLFMRAPTPVKLLDATHDFVNIEATWDSFRLAKRVFTRLDLSERVDILENDAPHNYNRLQREAAARWMARWLQHRDVEIHEPELQLFTEEELRCTPRGQVMLLAGARSVHDLLRDDADQAANERAQAWGRMSPEERRQAVRRLAHFPAANDLPAAGWTPAWSEDKEGYRVQAFRVRTADGAVEIPALWYEPTRPSNQTPIVFISSAGFGGREGPGQPAADDEDGRLAKLARSGRRLLALDVRGTGETSPPLKNEARPNLGAGARQGYDAYLLDRTYVGMQAEDILSALREAARRGGGPAELVAVGGVGVPAMHAAFSDPELVRHLTVEGAIASWDAVARADKTKSQFMNLVYGALRTYDLPDLAAVLGTRLEIVHPTDAMGRAESPAPASSGR